jgi:hypothetical protein
MFEGIFILCQTNIECFIDRLLSTWHHKIDLVCLFVRFRNENNVNVQLLSASIRIRSMRIDRRCRISCDTAIYVEQIMTLLLFVRCLVVVVVDDDDELQDGP